MSTTQAPLTGALSDYMKRLEAFREARLTSKPHIRSSYYRSPGVSEQTLERVAQAWGVDSLDEGIKNLYRQANGFQLTWVNSKHRFYNSAHGRCLPPKTRMPTLAQMEYFPIDVGGAFWILPVEEVFNLENIYEGMYSGAQDLDGSLRLFDGTSNFMPVCCLVKPGQPNPPLYRGDLFGAAWSEHGSLTAYLDQKLEAYLQAP